MIKCSLCYSSVTWRKTNVCDISIDCKKTIELDLLCTGSMSFGFLLARLESAYSLIWDAHEIWGQSGGGVFGTFVISRPI